MVVRWTEEADAKVDAICRFYANTNPQVANEIFADILEGVEQLKLFPKSAPQESLLGNRSELFRSLLVRRIFKIVYFIDEVTKEIVIVTIFDCRQSPKKLKKEIKKRF